MTLLVTTGAFTGDLARVSFETFVFSLVIMISNKFSGIQWIGNLKPIQMFGLKSSGYPIDELSTVNIWDCDVQSMKWSY